MANNKFYGYTPKTSKPSKQIEKAWSGEESGGSAYADLGNRLERVNRENVNKLNIITTNADIVVSDTKNYTTNHIIFKTKKIYIILLS